jgi:hypothetical protein
MTSIFIARYLGESADPILTAVQGFVTIDFLDVACKLLLSPTKYTESPRRKAGSTYTENFQRLITFVVQLTLNSTQIQ